MLYTIIIKSDHLSKEGRDAWQVAQDIIAHNHQINRIYFLFNGAYTANKFIDMPTDEFNLPAAWVKFATLHKVPLSVCGASALRRGISKDNIATGFSFGTIGELVESCAQADKVITL